MAKVKTIKFEVDGIEHVVIPRVLRRGVMQKIATLKEHFDIDDFDDPQEDWGVEWLSKSIDGEDPRLADEEVQSDAFVLCLDFFTIRLERMKNRSLPTN